MTTDSAEARKARPARLRRRDLAAYFPNNRLQTRMVLMPDKGDRGLLYVKNPKVATSSLLLWLKRLELNDPSWLPPRGSDSWKETLPAISDLGWQRARPMLAGSAFRFTFVRDPLRRFESAWRSKIAGVRQRRDPIRMKIKKPIQRILGLPTDAEVDIGFDAFVDAVERQDPLRQMNVHWRPQHLNLMHPLIEYDLVGRLENLDRDMVTLHDATGFRVPLPARNVREKTDSRVYDGRPDLTRRVQELFAEDYEIYGY